MPNGSIKYAQARPPEAKELTMPDPEVFVLRISQAFGKFPVELGEDNIERLTGMACMHTGATANPYDALVRFIKRYGRVSVWCDQPSVRDILEEEAKRRKETA